MARAPRTASFRLRFAASLGALAILTAGLAGASMYQPPKMNDVLANTERLVLEPDGRAQLTFSQPLSEESVTVHPETPIEANVDGRAITIMFTDRLQAGATYTLNYRATSEVTGATREGEASLTTPSLRLVTLVQGTTPGAPDRLVQYSIPSNEAPKDLATEQNIVSFAAGPTAVATISDLGEEGQRLKLHPYGAGKPSELMLEPGTRDLRPAFTDDGATLGLIYTEFGGTPTLRLYQATDTLEMGGPPLGPAEGEFYKVDDFYFEPGTANIVLREVSGREVRIPFGAEAEPSTAPWPGQSATPASPLNVPELGVLSITDERSVRLDEREVFTPAAASSTVTEVCLSPNLEFGYAQVRSADDAAATEWSVFRLDNGEPVTRGLGTNASWCALRW